MMVRSQIKQAAKDNLRGRWTKPVVFTLLYGIIVYLIQLILAYIPVIGPIASFVVMVPMAYIFAVSFMRMKREEDVGYVDFLLKIPDNFVASWKVFGRSFNENASICNSSCSNSNIAWYSRS